MADRPGAGALHDGAGAGVVTSTSRGWHQDRRTSFYRLASALALATAAVGFFLTYLQPLASGTFTGPRWAHVHGALLASWLILVGVQSWLLPGHRTLGWLALALVPAIAISTVAIGLEATQRDLASGLATGMVGNVTGPLVFCALVGAALWMRRQPQWHKRLIFIATVVVLWPAWFRWRHFLPWMPRPDVTLGLFAANAPIALAMLRDRWCFGKVHPAYWFVGLPVFVWQALEVVLFGSQLWTDLGLWLYRALA